MPIHDVCFLRSASSMLGCFLANEQLLVAGSCMKKISETLLKHKSELMKKKLYSPKTNNI